MADLTSIAQVDMPARPKASISRRPVHSLFADATTDTITKLANTIGNGLRKGNRSQYVADDGEWPACWGVIKTD